MYQSFLQAAGILLFSLPLLVAPSAAADVGEVIVMPAVAHSAPLFDVELEPVEEAVRGFLTGAGYRLAPTGIVDRADRTAREGRQSASGPICAVAPSVSDVLSHDPDTETRAEIAVGWLCNPGPGGCRWADALRVVLVGPSEDGDVRPLRHWRADVSDPTPAGWAAAANRLIGYTPMGDADPPDWRTKKGAAGLRIVSRVTFEPGKKPAGRGGSAPSALNSLDSVFKVGATSESAEAKAAREKEEARARRATARADKKERKSLASCFRPVAMTAASAVLAVDAEGQVQSCQARHDEWIAAGERFDTCLCRRLSNRGYAAGASPRRVVVDLMNWRRDPKPLKNKQGDVLVATVRVDGVETEPGFQGEELVERAADRLAFCASPRGVPAKVEVLWRVRADGGAGEPLVAVDGPMPDLTRACVERQLTDVAFPCTATGQTARVMLKVTIDRVKRAPQAAKTPF